MRALKVFLYGQPIGTLTHLPGDGNLFVFDEGYIVDPHRPILSLSFKDKLGGLISRVPITQTRLPPFFSNLLPEGALREYLGRQAGVNPLQEFVLLEALGQDLPGAVTVQPLDAEGFLMYPQEISKKRKATVLRFSLAGIQLKFSATKKADHRWVIPNRGIGGEWIVKLPHSIYRGVPENEYAMMELARKVGIEVPETSLRPIKDVQGLPQELEHRGNFVFAIKRFDRQGEGQKIHIEDFAQVFGVYPEKKYKSASYRTIAEVVWRETGEIGLAEFVRRLVFNTLIGNGDMHLKNWSFIYREKDKPALAPAYDFVSTILYLQDDQLALNFVDRKEFAALTWGQFKRLVTRGHLPEALVLSTAEETLKRFKEAWANSDGLPLAPSLRKAISDHLKTLPLWM